MTDRKTSRCRRGLEQTYCLPICIAFDHAFLSSAETRIVNEVRDVGRVVYDVAAKPPGTIEWA